MPALVGRDEELAAIDELLDRARGGMSGVLVVRGEAGIGKTSLLDHVAASAADFELLRVIGIESEMHLGFAGLHQLLTPFLGGIDVLPPPQARALAAAFGMTDEAAPDQFLIALAALTLITSAAERRPLLIVLDDAQWLDPDSADALGILARRLHADRVCLLISMRDAAGDGHRFDGISSLTLTSLGGDSSVELLERSLQAPVADEVRDRLVADARGNPLALIEFGRELSAGQRAGTEPLPPALPVARELEGLFLRQLDALPDATQRVLLVVAAEPSGDLTTVLRAAAVLGLDEGALAPARTAGLLADGPGLSFRHPLVRAAVYQRAAPVERRRAHGALADATDAGDEPLHRAWHRAVAADAPDDDVAGELERAAQISGGRGGCAAASSLLTRAAELTSDPEARAARHFAAAVADLTAGNTTRARTSLELARPGLRDPLLAAQARRVEGAIAYLGSGGADGGIVATMVESARTLAPLDVNLARDVIFDTLPMAIYFGASSAIPVSDIARLARTFELPRGAAPSSADQALDAIAALFTEELDTSIPQARRALAAVLADPDISSQPRYLARACYLPQALSDHDAWLTLASACVAASREQGSFQSLLEGLSYLLLREICVGSLDAAATYAAEHREFQEAVQRMPSRTAAAHELIVSAWRDSEATVRERISALESGSHGLGYVMMLCRQAQVILALSSGSYQVASSLVHDNWLHNLGLGGLHAADAVEAHVRGGDREAALEPARYLADRARATGSGFDRGLLSRSTALLSDEDGAEAAFRDSIEELGACGARLHVARTELVYGEWLRRQKRRRDAREHLEAAQRTFEAMGARNFAERARVELRATGAHARKRVDETRDALTPQESQVARLAAAGLHNTEIAERLFISASTVDYHLRKVYRKLDITSRHALGSLVST
ncbi:MAG: AAA family ATPase [Actinomycetota bacterium]|nr:AAA family ATPase [Actinomycetota bacterium]